MKTEKQVRTWYLGAHHNDPDKPIYIFDLYFPGSIQVIHFDDHEEIVAELEKERDEWKSKAEGWFCVGCQKYMKALEALAEDEK